MKNYILLILILIGGCTKESVDNPQLVQLLVEGSGTYLVTYGTSNIITVKGEDKWATSMNANPGDTIQFSVRTAQVPVTIYLRVEIQDGLLYCKSLYIEPESSGSLHHILTP